VKNALEFSSKKKKLTKNSNDISCLLSLTIATIHTDNICELNSHKFDFENHYKIIEEENKSEFCNKILIDAVDIDKILINISPFITTDGKSKFFFKINSPHNNHMSDNPKDKLKQIHKMKKNKFVSVPKKFRLTQEVPIIILKKLLECNSDYLHEPFMQSILKQKKYSPFFNKFMLNLAKFYQHLGYNHIKTFNKSTFLHNIYYRYLSKSYKRALELLENNQIDLNFHKNDARHFIKTTSNTYNFIFLDAFTPAKCPTLWSLEFFKELYLKLDYDGMILTYSNSAAIRNAFLQNGFHVGKIYDSKTKKAIGTVAVKNHGLIDHNLDERDLALIHSKAGICFKDDNLELDNQTIIKNRENEVKNSELISSTKVLKGDYGVKSL
jgi:hypothetical protein